MQSGLQSKPIIALAMGYPAGPSPELTAKIAAFDEVHAVARLIVERRSPAFAPISEVFPLIIRSKGCMACLR